MQQRLTHGNNVQLNRHGVRTLTHPAEYAGPLLGKSLLLDDLIEEMADWDIPCPDQARALSLKIIPGNSPILAINYRKPPSLTRSFGPKAVRQPDLRNFATRLHRGLVIIQPDGALGVMVVRLKAETAARLLGELMPDVLDTQIGLDELFLGSRISRLEEDLARAGNSAERFASVENFFQFELPTRTAESTISRAAALLLRNPQLRIRQLAAGIDISERQLLRHFNAMFGIGTKQFARIARLERVMAARARGATWGDAAYQLGFSDQAHMINEFTEIVGISPAELIRPGWVAGDK
jgi:AraC-like DNA-binding protein